MPAPEDPQAQRPAPCPATKHDAAPDHDASPDYHPIPRPKRAIVLLSGGLDSSTVAAFAQREGYELIALSFKYGQRHGRELQAAAEIARLLGIAEHIVVDLDLGRWGGSSLTDPGLELPLVEARTEAPDNARSSKHSEKPDDSEKSAGSGDSGDPNTHHPSLRIPNTYVPGRNTVFIAVALSLAEARDAEAIFLGINAVDYSGYPDCRPDYLQAFRHLAALSSQAGREGRAPRLEAPLIALGKVEIVQLAQELGLPIERTWSCYAGGDAPCGRCDSCRIRDAALADAGILS
jgi:7-cyano-7-deazaguanine synthase